MPSLLTYHQDSEQKYSQLSRHINYFVSRDLLDVLCGPEDGSAQSCSLVSRGMQVVKHNFLQIGFNFLVMKHRSMRGMVLQLLDRSERVRMFNVTLRNIPATSQLGKTEMGTTHCNYVQ